MGKTLIRFRTGMSVLVRLCSPNTLLVSIEPAGTPCILSMNTELIIAPKTRKTTENSTKAVSTMLTKSELVRARVLPNHTQPKDILSKLDEGAAVYAPPSLYQTLATTDGTSEVYVHRLFPPIKDISRNVKHLSSSDKSTSKPLALKRLQEASSSIRSKEMAQESSPSIPLKELHGLPDGHVIAHQLTGIRGWDIIQY